MAGGNRDHYPHRGDQTTRVHHGTVAMGATMATAILGASVDTGVLPPIVHAFIARRHCQRAAALGRHDALKESRAAPDEVNHLLARDRSAAGLSSARRSSRLRPLNRARVSAPANSSPFSASINCRGSPHQSSDGRRSGSRHRESVQGSSAESPPRTGRDARQAGIVSARAVLLEGLSVAQNLAVLLRSEIDRRPMPGERAVRRVRRGLEESTQPGARRRPSPPGPFAAAAARALALGPAVVRHRTSTAAMGRDEWPASAILLFEYLAPRRR